MNRWLTRKGAVTSGPFSDEQIEAMMQSGAIAEDTQILDAQNGAESTHNLAPQISRSTAIYAYSSMNTAAVCWVLVLPAGLVAAVAVGFTFAAIEASLGVRSENLAIAFEFITAAARTAAFVIAGALTAPRANARVAFILVILAAIFSFWNWAASLASLEHIPWLAAFTILAWKICVILAGLAVAYWLRGRELMVSHRSEGPRPRAAEISATCASRSADLQAAMPVTRLPDNANPTRRHHTPTTDPRIPMKLPVLVTSSLLLLIALFPAHTHYSTWDHWGFITSGGKINWDVMALEAFAAVAIGGILWAAQKKRS